VPTIGRVRAPDGVLVPSDFVDRRQTSSPPSRPSCHLSS